MPLSTRRSLAYIHKGQTASYKIEVKTIDEIVSQCQIPRIDLLKIDVEGQELAKYSGFRISSAFANRPDCSAETYQESRFEIVTR
jgi:FkbM family methyltransferase